ncbi:MAG: carbamoyl-phosphate synthase large subunit [Bdellovibrionaceae bacterium]|nr:carbamoyl-phosphate synthase large subunit [Pseudobdellovibrionaceae bacterium]
MPKRKDLKKILIIGSGPIAIGQACEFDYSGVQACKALMAEGFEVILVNSNPATIMTDAHLATRVYIEPLTIAFVSKILEKEKPDAVIASLGGQTALNLALSLDKTGIFKKLNIELLGSSIELIQLTEDRAKFDKALKTVGARSIKNFMVRSFVEGMEKIKTLEFPVILRPNYTLGGGGGGLCHSLEEYKLKLASALHESPSSEVLVEPSIYGWKEFELEIMRDSQGTFVVVCSIENLDPCGIHTGDSITVAPQQTLSDFAYQQMRTEAYKIIDYLGLESGGANIQFAVNPNTGERVVIEVNPRVSRSSALASKATGFPIAKIAALLAVGYTLNEIPNDITKTTLSCYEPALDYVVVKVPYFNFNKFAGALDELSTQMKSVGEAMGVGRTFQEALQSALLSLEEYPEAFPEVIFSKKKLARPSSNRIYHIAQAFREGLSVREVYQSTYVTPWFLDQIQNLVDVEKEIKEAGISSKHPFTKDSKQANSIILKAKRKGFSDFTLAKLLEGTELNTTKKIQQYRWKNNIHPGCFNIDTCAGEFFSSTPYYYLSYWGEGDKGKGLQSIKDFIVMIGGGPNRIGQSIEFDYNCVKTLKALQKENKKIVMLNSNPETVSTDYDTADCLFFLPLLEEHTSELFYLLKPQSFVYQCGGQTALNLAEPLGKFCKPLGSSISTLKNTEDRKFFKEICHQLGLNISKSKMVSCAEEALGFVSTITYPVICRPSYVLGGKRMRVVHNDKELSQYFLKYKEHISKNNLCLVDQFLENALELDVDLIVGTDWSFLVGIMEHIEFAGVHSGDSMSILPPQRLKKAMCDKVEAISKQLATALGVQGFLNIQLAIKDNTIYILEANPRTSRSLPFMTKAIGGNTMDLGAKALLGHDKKNLSTDLLNTSWRDIKHVCIKALIFPFNKFSGVDTVLGPEMKSTGEVMGRGKTFSEALFKAFEAAYIKLPKSGEVFLSLRDKDKNKMLTPIKKLQNLGYTLSATRGTAQFLIDKGIQNVLFVNKITEPKPHCIDRIRSQKIQLVINTPSGQELHSSGRGIRRSCIEYSVPCITEDSVAEVITLALEYKNKNIFDVYPL